MRGLEETYSVGVDLGSFGGTSMDDDVHLR